MKIKYYNDIFLLYQIKMSFSITNSLKTNYTSSYDIEELQNITINISKDSNNKFSPANVLKIICKYSIVENKKIFFDITKRNDDKTFEILENEYKNSVVLTGFENLSKFTDKNKSETKKSGFGNLSNFVKKDEYEEPKKEIKKNGFGNLSNFVKKSESEEPKKEIKKSGFGNLTKFIDKSDSEEPKKIKKGGFGNLSKFVNDTEENIKSDNVNILKPFGTDNYGDKIIKDDKWTEEEIKRSNIYQKLASQYYPAQRSKEWFEMRDKMITASDGGTIVGVNPYEKNYNFISKKVHGKPFETSMACYHGKKMEQVATMIYEYRMNVKVMEFGLCQHPTYNFLGASPDGIVSNYKLKTKNDKEWDELFEELKLIKNNEDKIKFLNSNCYKTKYVGRMLEIKCPTGRKIIMDENAPEVYGVHGEPIKQLYYDVKKGICPTYYWVQVQLQLQCCNLDECDFWQMSITEYKNKEEFDNDTNENTGWLNNQFKMEKGAFIQILPKQQLTNNILSHEDKIYNYANFIYPPKINMTIKEIEKWIFTTLQNLNETHSDYVFDKIIYWKVENSRNITIKRDDKWFNENLSKFKESWDLVLFFRSKSELSILFKKYLKTFPLDNFKNIKEPNDIMKTILKIYEGDKKIIKDIENKVKNIGDDVVNNIDNDIEVITKELLNKKNDEKIIELIKRLKFDLQ